MKFTATKRIKIVDVKSTQESAVLGALTNLCGFVLTAAQVDKVNKAIKSAMREGCDAWAFDPEQTRNAE